MRGRELVRFLLFLVCVIGINVRCSPQVVGSVGNELFDAIVDSHLRSKSGMHNSFPDFGVHELTRVVPVAKVCPNSVQIETISFKGVLVLVCIAANRQQLTIARFNVPENHWQPLLQMQAISAQRLALFTDENILHILVADEGKELGIDLIRLNPQFHLMPKEHTVNSHFQTAVAVWESAHGNKLRLTIANSISPRGNRTNLQSFTSFYSWQKGYFDHFDEYPSFLVKDLCPFIIYGSEYIAIINQRSGDYNHDVDSQILQLDESTHKWKLVQSIRTFTAADAEFFSLGPKNEEEHFLVIANEYNIRNGRPNYATDSVVYKFVIDKFVPFQCLKTIGATQVKAYKGSHNEFALFVATRVGVKIFQYNGWRFAESGVTLTANLLGPTVASFTITHFEKKPVLLVSRAIENHQPNVFELVFVFENKLGEWQERTLKWCGSMLNIPVEIPAIDEKMRHVFYVNQKKIINLPGNLQLDEFTTAEFSSPIISEKHLNRELSHQIIADLIKMEDELRLLEIEMMRASQELKSAVRLASVLNQKITAPMNFSDALIRDSHIDAINVQHLNGNLFQNIGARVIRTDVDQTVPENIQFASVQSRDVLVNGLIDGVRSEHIVTVNGNHHLNFPIQVDQVETHNFNVSGLINGHPINPNEVLMTVGDQFVDSELVFNERFTVDNVKIDFIDGEPMNRFLSSIVTIDGNHAIKGPKFIKTFETRNLNQFPRSTINGIDMMQHWYNQLWVNGNQAVTGQHLLRFTDMIVNGDLITDGLVNRVRVPSPHFVRTKMINSQPIFVNGEKQFKFPTFIRSAMVRDSLNRIPVRNGYLEILLTNVPQTIPGHFTFRGIRLREKSNVFGKVDGIKLATLLERTRWKNVTQVFNRLVVDGNAKFLNGITVKGTVCNVPLRRLYYDTVLLTDTTFPAFPRLRFNNFAPQKLNAPLVNGFNVGRDFLTTNTEQRIEQQVIFNKIVRVRKTLTVTTINNIEVNDLRNSLLLHGPQTIENEMTVDGNLHVNGLQVQHLNRVNMDNVVYLHKPQEITASKVFTNIHLKKDLFADRIYHVREINGIPFPALIQNTLRYKDPQTVIASKRIQSISVPMNSRVIMKSVNNINLRRVQQDALLRTVPNQNIYGRLRFNAPVFTHDLKFASLFDGVAFNEILHSWVLQGTRQRIGGNVIVANNLLLRKNLHVKGLINGVDLNALKASVVNVREKQFLFNQNSFLNRVNAKNDVRVFGKVGRIDLSRDTVKKHSRPQVIYGHQSFGSIRVTHKLSGKGWFNGIQVRDLCVNSVRKFGPQIISAPVVIDGNVTFHKLITRGPVNGVDLRKLSRTMVFRDQSMLIRGRKTFDTLIVEGPMHSTGLLSGINWRKLSQVFMSRTRIQTINSKLIFASGLAAEDVVSVGGNFNTHGGLINNISLPDIDRNALKHGTQKLTGHYVFENAVKFQSNLFINNDSINGIGLNRDLMMKRGFNVVSVPKVIGNVVVRRDVDMLSGRRINGVDFSRIVSNTVTRHGKQHIFGMKRFSHLETTDVFSRGLISGIHFSDKIIAQAHKPQQLRGETHFANGFSVLGNLNVGGLVNNIDLRKLQQELVLKNKNNVILARHSITSHLRILKQLNTSGDFGGINLNTILDFNNGRVSRIDLLVNEIQNARINAFASDINWQASQVNYFQQTDYRINERIIPIDNKEPRSNLFYFSLIDKIRGCQTLIVKYFVDKHIVMPLRTFNPLKVVEFIQNNRLHLLVVNKAHYNVKHLEQCLSHPLRSMKVVGNGNSLVQLFVFDDKLNTFVQSSNLLLVNVLDVNLLSNNEPSVCFSFTGHWNASHSYNILVSCIQSGIFTHPKTVDHRPPSDKISTLRSSTYGLTLTAAFFSKPVNREFFKVHILKWMPNFGSYAGHFQTITAVKPELLHFAETRKHTSLKFLFVGEGKSNILRNEALLRIFRFNHGVPQLFIETQQIRVNSKSIDSVHMPDGRLLVLILTHDSLINIYELKGASGMSEFVLIDTIYVNGVDEFTARVSELGGKIYFQIAASSVDNSAYVYTARMKTLSKIQT